MKTNQDHVKALEVATDTAAKYARVKYNHRGQVGLEIAHIHSEVSEVYKAFNKHEGRAKEIDEMSDVILNTFVLARYRKISIEDLFAGINAKAQVLKTRIADLKNGR